MDRRSSARFLNRRIFTAGLGAGFVFGAAPFHVARAQNAALKVGVLLPRSGAQAGIGQDCQRAVDIAPELVRSLGLPPLQIMNGDTESDPQVARTQAEKLVKEGAELLIGAFDSGQTTTIAQVAEQRGIPLVINIAAAPEITEQGYKFVFRNFPIARVVLSEAFLNQKLVFEASGVTPKSVVYMHVNDTLGSAMQKGVSAIFPKHDMPYQILQTIAYDPKSLDLALEVSRAKATGAEALLVTSRLNDAIILTRELVKQRWNPIAILSMGPGWYEDQYVKTLGKLASGPINFGPSYDPQKPLAKQLIAALAKAYPGVSPAANHVYTFEALLVAADAYKRAGSSDPKALADAIRTTNITGNVGIGAGIQFNERGQNDKIKCAATQIQDGRTVTIAPNAIANGKPMLPMTPYDKRG
jgi:branched-chain amino acid transport system substrate-binding protein